LFSLGEFTLAQHHYQQGMAIYDPRHHAQHASLYGGHDPGVCGLRHAAMMLWLLGYPDQALQRSNDALALAQKLSQPSSLCFALYFSAWVEQHRGERQAAQEHVEQTIALATEQSFTRWLAQGSILQGWLLVEEGKGREGILQMRTGGAVHVRERSHYAALLAEAHRKEWQIKEGLTVVIEELERTEISGEGYYEAELHRLKGELLLAQSAADKQQAEACFQGALQVARNQSAKSLELRAAMSLSRLWYGQGKKTEARQLLGDIYGWFTEGFDTADLKAAKALLEELT
jgi:predicted ATPase